ncbi:MAG: hypothetical protein Q7T07_14650 [Burkholderiaceae bacterium]|nr:hypothetical protein [Burkholderiaceae bacterium]
MDSYLRKRCPELERPLLAAIDAFDEIQSGGPSDKHHLKPLVDAASSDRVPLYENATNLLARLALTEPRARDAISEMAKDSQAHVRFNAVLCVSESVPGSFGRTIVSNALLDPSSRVREKAADWASRCSMKDLVPELREALKREPSEKSRRCLEYSIKALR